MAWGSRIRRLTGAVVTGALVALALTACFAAPDTQRSKNAIAGEHCVTWSHFESDYGGPDSVSSWSGEIGLRADCGASDIARIAAEAWAGAGGYEPELDLYVAPTSAAADDSDDADPYLDLADAFRRPVLVLEDDGDAEFAASDFTRIAGDWMTLRGLDPDAALVASTPSDAETTAAQAPTPTPSSEADEEAWVRVPDEDAALRLSAAPPSGMATAQWNLVVKGAVPMLLEGAGMPSAVFIRLGFALEQSGIIPEAALGAVRVSAPAPDGDAPHGSNAVAASVVLAARDGSYDDPYQLPSTSAWPEVESAIDELDALGRPFTFSIGTADLNGDGFGTLLMDLDDDAPTLASTQCTPGSSQWSKDHDPTADAAMYAYWLDPARPRSPDSEAVTACPQGADTPVKQSAGQ